MSDSAFEERGIEVVKVDPLPCDIGSPRCWYLFKQRHDWKLADVNRVRIALLSELGCVGVGSFEVTVSVDGEVTHALHGYDAVANLVEDMSVVSKNLREVEVRKKGDLPEEGLSVTCEFELVDGELHRDIGCADLNEVIGAKYPSIELTNGARHIMTLVRRDEAQRVGLILTLHLDEAEDGAERAGAMHASNNTPAIAITPYRSPVVRCAFQAVGDAHSPEGFEAGDILMEVVTNGAATPGEALARALGLHPDLPRVDGRDGTR